MQVAERLAVGLLIAATLAYCWAIWWVSALFSAHVFHNGESYETTQLSVVLLGPIPDTLYLQAVHWQLSALFSLAIAVRSALKRQAQSIAVTPPLLAHGLYLFTISALHVVGFLASFVAIAYVID